MVEIVGAVDDKHSNPKVTGWKVRFDAHHRIDIAVKLQEIMLKQGKPNERTTPKDLSDMQWPWLSMPLVSRAGELIGTAVARK